MIREHSDSFARIAQVPCAHCFVHGASDDLRLHGLCHTRLHRMFMSAQHHYLMLGANIPDTARTVTTARKQNIELRMQCETIDATQMPMILSDHAIRGQVPATHLFILAARKHVGRFLGHGQSTHMIDVSGECQLQRARRQLPNLDRAICRASTKPFIRRIDRYSANPTHVTRYHFIQLPWTLPLRCNVFSMLLNLVGGSSSRLFIAHNCG
mmetsp:Transcript_27752/g.45766  ORF Transcript_27752/g.45766 Transcript_27752/m.45766 type:complete len:211 (-) Transcript_27752:473-1105(-)